MKYCRRVITILDYISILADGICPFNCSFCVGNSIRKNKKPSFAPLDKIDRFLKFYEFETDKLSISGSTSDPLLVENLDEVLELVKTYNYKVSLHSCDTNHILYKSDEIFNYVDKLCISLHSLTHDELLVFIAENNNLIRISTVYNEQNWNIIDCMDFFDLTPAKSFTVRKNIFHDRVPRLQDGKFIGRIYHQPVYKYNDQEIVLWDFADANKHINARYLWGNGVVNKQCFWNTLHKGDDKNANIN